jgi:Zn-dependent protease with chaperone function
LPLFGVGLLCFVFVAIPWLLRLLLGLRPLPDGPLRDRLTATARRLNFRFSDLLVWPTRNSVANAMVTGPMPFLRYVILTDRLINEMTSDEIEAVFGHEIGHVRHHHMLFYFGFLLASLLIAAVLWNASTRFLGPLVAQQWLIGLGVQVGLVMVLGAYIFIVFGFVSRRCERQADVFGCRVSSCQTFVETLEKVARLNGIHREKPGWLSSWQHSTIARRVAFLERMSADPAVEPRFQRHAGFVKLGALLALGAALLGLGAFFGPKHVWASLSLSRVEASASAPE